jgi:hypothetical protein
VTSWRAARQISSCAFQHSRVTHSWRRPAAVLCGGGRASGSQAGSFALTLAGAPSNLDNDFGFRCAQ